MKHHTHFAAALLTTLACAPLVWGQTAPAPTAPTPAPSKPAEQPKDAPAPKAPDVPASPDTDKAPIPAAARPAPRTDKWWTDKHAAILANVKQGGHQTVFLGNSITEGWNGAGKKVWQEQIADAKAVNCGIGGDRTQHVLARLDDGLLEALAAPNNSVTTIVLLIGTNNTSPPADPAEDIAAGVHEIVTILRGKFPDAQLVLMAILPRGEKPNAQREVITKANTLIKAQNASAKTTFVDLGPKFMNAQGEIPRDLMPDFLHLSEAGYRVWAEGIKDQLTQPKSE